MRLIVLQALPEGTLYLLTKKWQILEKLLLAWHDLFSCCSFLCHLKLDFLVDIGQLQF